MSFFAELQRRNVLRVGADRVIMVVLALALGYFAFDQFVLDPQREANAEARKAAELEQAREQGRSDAQLIEARTDRHLWSHTWDLTLDDIFAIQKQIAGQVVERLKLTLLEEPLQPAQTNPEAYAQYLQARFLGGQGNAEAYTQAIALLEQVLTVDPDYVKALDMLASIYINQISDGLRPADEGFELVRQVAEKALAIDPDFASPHVRLAWIATHHDGNLQQSARHYQRAMELAPNNERIFGEAASLLKTLGRMKECIALDELIGTYERDAAYNIAYVMAWRGETGKAFEWLGKAVEYSDPGLTEIAIEPLFRNIESDARWLPFLTSVGKSPEQLDAIEFKVTLPAGTGHGNGNGRDPGPTEHATKRSTVQNSGRNLPLNMEQGIY